MINSHCWPRANPGSDWFSSEARQAGSDRSSLRAGMMTESSRSGTSVEFKSCSGSVSFTTSYYRKWSVSCVESGQVCCWERCWLAGCDRGSHPGNIDKPAPQFVMGDGTRTVDLSKLRGRVVVLNLWATWCAPCIEELPSLLALQKQMPELAVVAVSMDQDPDVYRRFLADHHVDRADRSR